MNTDHIHMGLDLWVTENFPIGQIITNVHRLSRHKIQNIIVGQREYILKQVLELI